MAFYDPTMFEVHVLLVDHDLNSLYETTRLLHFNSYKVTSVVDARLASSILSKGNTTFNLVMVEVQPPRFEGFQLMNEAVRMDLPVIVMSTSATPMLVKCAIEEGAFLFVQKPPSQEDLKYLWQHVVREGTRKNKGKAISVEELNHFSFMCKGETSSVNIAIGEKGSSEIFSLSSDNGAALQCTSMKPKMCTEWTPELHQKFMNAVNKLGDERCFPKDILELMNVKGLTRMQVASHLQKCRLGWKPSNEKLSVRRQKAPKSPNPSSNKGKKYGLLPNMARSYIPQFPSDITQNEEQVHVASSSSVNTKSSIIISDSDFMLNMSQHGIWVDMPFANNNMNEIFLDENFMNGHMLVGPSDYMLQPHEASFDFAATDHGLMIGNNFNNEFDLDQVFIGQAYEIGSTSAPTPTAANDNGTNDATMDSDDLGDSWVNEFPREH